MKFGFVAIVAAIQIFAATAFAAPIAVANNDLAKRSPSGDVAGLSSAWKRDDDDSVEAAGLTGAPVSAYIYGMGSVVIVGVLTFGGLSSTNPGNGTATSPTMFLQLAIQAAEMCVFGPSRCDCQVAY
ncbi:hypothetical protein FRC03_010028 [Tulasnella sp. 419]|nr:hypothetical protein FRC03_010028 [Tulasnella sp. 419]